MPTPVSSKREAAEPTPARRFPFLPALLLGIVIVAGAVYGKLGANLYSENFNIAQAMVAGKGYANAIGQPTGPTAWSAPVLPLIQAGLLWAGEGNRAVVVAGLVVLQVCVLIGTGVLVVALAARTTQRLGAGVAATLFALGLLYHFFYWFQVAHDCWVILLVLDLLIAGFCLLEPLDRWPRAAGWGLIGALCALTNPAVGLAWGVLSLVLAVRQRAWSQLAVAALVAGLALAPWTVRNYLVFGHFIPVKSNLAYEMYQSQCLQADGLYQTTTAPLHPSSAGSRERQEYRKLGEAAYLDRKWQQFREAVEADPWDFFDRVASRFLGATVWYVPFNRAQEARRPWLLWARRLTFPLPFLAMLFLIFSAARQPLQWPQGVVIGVYLLYLLPYIAASYYERYTVPLVAVKVLLVLWAADRLLARPSRPAV
jgi:hypothetical protein